MYQTIMTIIVQRTKWRRYWLESNQIAILTCQFLKIASVGYNYERITGETKCTRIPL